MRQTYCLQQSHTIEHIVTTRYCHRPRQQTLLSSGETGNIPYETDIWNVPEEKSTEEKDLQWLHWHLLLRRTARRVARERNNNNLQQTIRDALPDVSESLVASLKAHAAVFDIKTGMNFVYLDVIRQRIALNEWNDLSKCFDRLVPHLLIPTCSGKFILGSLCQVNNFHSSFTSVEKYYGTLCFEGFPFEE
jgi:hypothetical protein